MTKFFNRTRLCFRILANLFNLNIITSLNFKSFLKHLKTSGLDVLFINIITSFFISLVLSLQIVKEFLYLNAVHMVSSMLAISFIRELSPILTAIIVIGKVGSLFTSEIATMVVSEQVDSLLILGINPINYLIYPRIVALMLMLPLLNLFSLFTSFISSSFICFFLYDISPDFFL